VNDDDDDDDDDTLFSNDGYFQPVLKVVSKRLRA